MRTRSAAVQPETAISGKKVPQSHFLKAVSEDRCTASFLDNPMNWGFAGVRCRTHRAGAEDPSRKVGLGRFLARNRDFGL